MKIDWTTVLTMAGTLVTTVLCGRGCISADEGTALTSTGVAFGVAGATFITTLVGVIRSHRKDGGDGGKE